MKFSDFDVDIKALLSLFVCVLDHNNHPKVYAKSELRYTLLHYHHCLYLKLVDSQLLQK